MSFTSRRLRVQLPCGEQTIVELDEAEEVRARIARPLDPTIAQICVDHFQTRPWLCQFQFQSRCLTWQSCLTWRSNCGFVSPQTDLTCFAGTRTCFASPIPTDPTITTDPTIPTDPTTPIQTGTPVVAGPREVLVEPQHLDVLRSSLNTQLEALRVAGEQLQARIDEIEQAREQLRKRDDG